MSQFETIYNREKHVVEASDLWDAKQKAIEHFKVPKSKQGLIAVQSLTSKENEDFRYQ